MIWVPLNFECCLAGMQKLNIKPFMFKQVLSTGILETCDEMQHEICKFADISFRVLVQISLGQALQAHASA